nr:reverse transcriptase domain-containing protein [Tanacetum cinerariifolium]
MEPKDTLSLCSDSNEQEIQQLQKQAKIFKDNSMNKFNALKTTTQRLKRQTFTNCPSFKRAFSHLFHTDVRTFKFKSAWFKRLKHHMLVREKKTAVGLYQTKGMIKTDQNAVKCDDERDALANLIVNLKLDIDENKKIQNQLKKANASLTQELKECKSTLAETSRTLGESNSIWDSCLIALQNKQTELEKYMVFNDLTVDYKKLERKLNETLGLLAQNKIDIKEGLKLKAYEISVVKEKHDELVKQSLLTKSHYEGIVKYKTKVITDLKLNEEKDINKMISMEKQLKFLNEIVYKMNQSIQTIHMLAPKGPTFNGRPTFTNPMYLKMAQPKKPCLYEIINDQSDPTNRLIPDREETPTLKKESRSKMNKDLVRPYDYTKLNSLYENFKPASQEYHEQLAHANECRAPTALDMEVLIKTCLMPLAIKTQNDSFTFIHELKQEMHADLKKSSFAKPYDVNAPGPSRKSSKHVSFQSPVESVGSNDMVHNCYLEEAKKKEQLQKDKALNTKPSRIFTRVGLKWIPIRNPVETRYNKNDSALPLGKETHNPKAVICANSSSLSADLNFNISFADALILMPKFGPSIKSLLTNKDKLCELARTPLNEHCSAVLLTKFLKKLVDPDKFLIPCDFLGMAECLALADLDASINLMLLSVWNKLSFPDLSPMCMTLELADRSISHPVGVAEDVFVKVGTFHFPANFIVVDFDADPRVPLILRRSFLKTRRALIDVFKGKLTLRIGKEAITFTLDQTSRYSANYNDMTANRIDVIDMACEEYPKEVLSFFDAIASGNPTPYYDPIVSTTSPTLTPFGNSDFFLEEVDAFLAFEDDPTSPEVDQSYELKICEAKSDKSSIDETPEVELKDLPPHPEYAFLEGGDKFPVIIAKDLSVEEKTALITVLKSHKRAIPWKLSDIKGIDPKFCTRKILMEEDFEPAV